MVSSARFAVQAVGPTSVGAVAWRFRGVLRVTVIAKATFAFAGEGVMPRADPLPFFRAEVTWDKSPMRSVRYPSDVVPYLHEAEVLFSGRAHTPFGRPLEHMPVRLGLFEGVETVLDKTLVIRKKGGFTEMPIEYERAYGGAGFADNPLGAGAVPGTGEPAVLDPFDDRRHAGYGPIGAAWPARKRLLGAMPRKALDANVVELPDDFDFAYFQAAPADQRVRFLRGDEWIVMDGLHPTVPRFRTQLPGARGLARVHGLSRWGVPEGQPLALHADTLRIEGEEQRVTLTFRGVFPVADEEALGAVHVVAGVELPGEPLAWPTPSVAAARPADDAPAPLPAGGFAATISTAEALSSVEGKVLDGTLDVGPDSPRSAALPFRPGPASAS
ncbi:MAG TPA: DUF2169 domain-containing protein, partial [Minicystis sp.]|nr:DUF2169 domain-containing protein [Minicystis sp.]